MEVKRSCQTQNSIAASRIKPMIRDARLKFTNHAVNWFVGNYTNDFEKHEQVLVLKDVFRHYEFENYPLRYNSTKEESKADIKIYFVAKDGIVYCEGDKQFKCPFEISDDTLAVAYAPYGGEWQGYVFINDNLFWDLRKDVKGKHQLYETLVHELGHTHNIDHSTKATSIMFWEERENQTWESDCVNLLFDLYKDERLKALKKTESGIRLIAFSNAYAGERNRLYDNHTEQKNNFNWVLVLYALAIAACFFIASKLV